MPRKPIAGRHRTGSESRLAPAFVAQLGQLRPGAAGSDRRAAQVVGQQPFQAGRPRAHPSATVAYNIDKIIQAR